MPNLPKGDLRTHFDLPKANEGQRGSRFHWYRLNVSRPCASKSIRRQINLSIATVNMVQEP